MHMACHIKDCMLDYGPLSSFWCFAFERYNGTLEGIKKSWNEPEKQMLIKFASMQHMSTLQSSLATRKGESHNEDFIAMICSDKNLFQQHMHDSSSLSQASLYVQNQKCRVSI